MTNPLAALVQTPKGPAPWKIRDGEVVGLSPLSVLLDGDTSPVTPTKAPLFPAPAVGDRVCLVFIGRDLLPLGRYGG